MVLARPASIERAGSTSLSFEFLAQIPCLFYRGASDRRRISRRSVPEPISQVFEPTMEQLPTTK